MGNRYKVNLDIRSVINADGGVLLDLRRGRCLSLNPVGGQIWSIMGQHSEGLSAEGIVDEMLLLYEGVEINTLQRDVARFLSELEDKALISNGNGHRQLSSSLKRALPRLEQIMSAPLSDQPADSSSSTAMQSQTISDETNVKGSFLYSLLAILALIGADLTMKVAGFPLLYRIVRRWPTRRSIAPGESSAARICTSVDAACRYYLKHALCLQRSAVATCLLRLAGVPAQMVIGCRKMPFKGHAWVEVNNRVVNDNPKVQTFYSVLERC